MLRFLLDQNLSPQTTLFLRRLGYDVTDVREQKLVGATDDELLSFAIRDSRIILTFDSFAELMSIVV